MTSRVASISATVAIALLVAGSPTGAQSPLSFPATYEGRGACGNAPHAPIRVTLIGNGYYVESCRAAAEGAHPATTRGTWLLHTDSDAIGLTSNGTTAYYRIAGTTLVMLDPNGDAIRGPQTVLKRTSHVDAQALAMGENVVRMTLESSSLWTLIEIGGKAIVASGDAPAPTLTFEGPESSVSGFTGCNRLVGKYKSDEGMLHFTPLATTRMMCAHPAVDEHAFITALATITRYTIADGRLSLFADGDVPALVFRARTGPQ
jgi:heat shock protein HslJ